MEIKLFILNAIFLLTAVISIITTSLLYFKKKDKTFIFLYAILLISGLLSLQNFFNSSGLSANNTKLLFLPINFLLALGPSIYIYTKLMISKQFKFKTVHFVLFLPVLIEFTYYTFLFLLGAQEKIQFSINYHQNIISPIEQAFGIIYTSIFLIISLVNLTKYEEWIDNNFSNKELVTLKWLRRLLIIYSSVWVIWCAISMLDYFMFDWSLNLYVYSPIYVLFSIYTLYVVLTAFNKKHSVLFKEYSFKRNENKDDIDILNEENIQLIYKLRQIMKVEKAYLDSNLKITNLAAQLNIPSHQLSQLLNSGLKNSFYEFVNYYRIEHVKKLLTDKQMGNLTIEAIAHESGFNSKSTFNQIFKKATKMTPKEFKKANQ